MSEGSSIEQVDALIQQGDFKKARAIASEISGSDLPAEEMEQLKTLNQALSMDMVTTGCIIGLSLLWIVLSLNAI